LIDHRCNENIRGTTSFRDKLKNDCQIRNKKEANKIDFMKCPQTTNLEAEETKDSFIKMERIVLNLIVTTLSLEARAGL
jgi:hypothetical protein